MLRHYGEAYSSALGRSMPHLVFGHAGAPVIVFPTSKGRFYQWEDFHMIQALREPLERGWLQLFCVDSVDELSWYNFEDHQRLQIEWHLAYEEYLTSEFLPWLRQINATPYTIVTGASFGGFHAVNFALRFPHLVNRAVALSGDYEAKKYVDGYLDDDVVANSPLDCLSQSTPESLAPRIRHVEFRLAAGRQDFCLGPTLQLSQQMQRLGIPHQCHVWENPGLHDWPLWREQVRQYL